MTPIELTVNGRAVKSHAQPRTHLADFMREELLLTGTHLGCEHGVCGACTVMIDGEPARSCIAFAVACDGADVRTVEGFADDALMQALREAFKRRHALQCGYCTPGMLITAYDIVRRLPDADRTRIREELAGNLCRCTGYVGIVDAIQDVLAAPPTMTDLRPATSSTAASVSADLPRASREIGSASAPAGPPNPGRTANAGNRIERKVSIAASSQALWETLRDPKAVVRCLPGAELVDEPQGNRLKLRLSIAIGPMRARFEGDAEVNYDDEAKRGQLTGSGIDNASRTTGEGSVSFELEVDTASRTDLGTAIDYRLAGPLAQFSRGAVIDSVVDRLLARFAENLAAAASGATVSDERSVGGLRLVVSLLWQRIRRIFDP